MRKSIISFAVLFCLLMTGTLLFAQTTTVWNPAGNAVSTGLWSEAANWTGGEVPEGDFKVVFNVPDAQACVLDEAHTIKQLVMGDNGDGDTLHVAAGGSLTTGVVWSAIGYNAPATMIVDAGATVTFGEHMWVGLNNGSDGVVVLNGGTINVSQMTGLGWVSGKGTVYVKSGDLNLANIHPNDSIKEGSMIDISGGTIYITGDHVAKIEGYVAAGRIVATGETGNVLAYFDADMGKTVVKDGSSSHITIDAEKDAFYDMLTGPDDGYLQIRSFAHNNNGAPDDDADLSAKLWASWDETYLYLYEEVVDDVVACDNPTSWQNDVMEVYLDPDPAGEVTQGQVGFHLTALDSADAPESAWSGIINLRGHNIALESTPDDYARKKTDDGYVLECRVPWAIMSDATRGPIVPAVDNVFGLAIMNHDNDAGQREGSVSWAAVLLDNVWNTPDHHGAVKFLADGKLMFIPTSARSGLTNTLPYDGTLPPYDITDLEGGHIKASNEDSLWTGPDSDGSPNGERIKFLIDNDVETKYLVGADESWIDFYTTTLSMVTSYTLTSANDVPERDPSSWLFQGWDAETLSWVTLDSVVDNPVWEERFQKRTFEIENDQYFSNYRLHILALNGDTQGLMQLAEWEIIGELGDEVDGDVTNYAFVTRGSNEDSLWTGPGGSGGSPDAEKLPKLTDNDINTKYLVDAVESWLDIHTTKMSKVTSYTITSANDAPSRDPNSWVLKGWDRMTTTWVTLDSVVGQPEWEERFQTKTFQVDNADQWFSSYRLHITALNSEDEVLMQMAELQLLGEIGEDVPADITDLKVEIVSENDDLPWTGPDSDGSPDNERIEKLIDNNAGTKFLVGDDMCWIDLYTKKQSMVNGYALTSANDVPERDPASWELQGWDGSGWVTLHSVTGQPMWEERFQTKTWEFDNDSLAFSTYRLNITAINGDTQGLMQIAELQLFGELVGNAAVQYPPTSVKDKALVVSNFHLSQNYPNPFNPTTTINFALPKSMKVKLTVFDILGREVTTLVNETMTEGLHNVTFEGARYASGVYFYRLEAGDKVFQQKMMLVK